MRFLDLSHTVEHGMITYPGLPGPEIADHLSFDGSAGVYAEGTEFQIGRISMVANTGTYLDTPAHRYRDGFDLSALPLERCASLPVTLVVADGEMGDGAIGAEAFAGLDLRGRAVLISTGWDRHWGTQEYGKPVHPHVTEAGAEALVAAGAALVGIDSVNIDDTVGNARPAHSVLLAAGIPVVEHLTRLAEVPADSRFTAVPVAVKGMATFPVRAFVALAG
jgi:kynurenine formamidase